MLQLNGFLLLTNPDAIYHAVGSLLPGESTSEADLAYGLELVLSHSHICFYSCQFELASGEEPTTVSFLIEIQDCND
jgi:hypothetical protein